MRNRNDKELDHHIRPKNPVDEISKWEKAVLTCSKCDKVLVKFPIDVTVEEQVAISWRIEPIIERAIHMHQCSAVTAELLTD